LKESVKNKQGYCKATLVVRTSKMACLPYFFGKEAEAPKAVCGVFDIRKQVLTSE
jgi:hypothetical protein